MEISKLVEHTASTRWLQSTRSNHAAMLRAVNGFFDKFPAEEIPTIAHVSHAHVSAWIEELRGKGLKPATINSRLSALSSVMAEAFKLGLITSTFRIQFLKVKNGRIRVLSVDEEQRLNDAFIKTQLGTNDGAQALHMTRVLLDTGLRLSEFFDARPCDVVDGQLTVWNGKGGHTRVVPLTARAATSWSYYQHLGRPLTKERYRAIWKAARNRMGMANDADFVPHMLRHTCASRIASAGISLGVLQKWLGHASLETTMRYVHFTPCDFDHARKALENFK